MEWKEKECSTQVKVPGFKKKSVVKILEENDSQSRKKQYLCTRNELHDRTKWNVEIINTYAFIRPLSNFYNLC